MGMLELEDTAATAQLLVECFLPLVGAEQAMTASATAAAAAAPTPPTMPRDALGIPIWPAPPPLGPVGLARWHVSFKGLHWRVGTRLQQPTLERSLESSLVLAVQSEATGDMVACAELSLRPADGSLPGEFAPSALTLADRAEYNGRPRELSAYVSNLAVNDEYRRRRLASRLLEACEEVAAARWRCHDIYLHVSNRKCAPNAPNARTPRTPRTPRPLVHSPPLPNLHTGRQADAPARCARVCSVAALGMYSRAGYEPLVNFDVPSPAGVAAGWKCPLPCLRTAPHLLPRAV